MSDYRKENSYSTILKRISSFGGVQLLNVAVNLVRGKFVAMFLGPYGMGLSSMFTSSTLTVQQFGSLGLNLALVKEIAASKDDDERLPKVMGVAVRLIMITSIIGAIGCILLSPLLSRWSFGNYDYTAGYVLLSGFVLLSIAGSGYLSLLQGMSEVKRLSKASIVGSGTGLLFGVPLYYFFGIDGIIPAMIILALAMFLFYYLSWRKAVKVKSVEFRWKENRGLVRKLLSLGFILMIGSLVGTLTGYLINIYISNCGSLEDVGNLSAANSITNQYVGIIFSALALDYFPRLSAVAGDAGKMSEVVSRQTEIVTMIIAPLVLILMLTAPLVIRIFLTEKYLVITTLVKWLGLGIMLQSAVFPLDYVFLAKDNRKVYVWMEVVASNVIWLSCSVGFYYLYALDGLGVSLVVRTLINYGITYCLCARMYSFRYTARVWKAMAFCYAMVAAGFLLAISCEGMAAYMAMGGIAVATAVYSFVRLRKSVREDR